MLGVAVEKNFVSVAKLLLGAKANVNQHSAVMRTPLSIAAHDGHDEMVRILLAHPEIEIDRQDAWQQSALVYATTKKHSSIVKQLLDAKASLDGSIDCLKSAGFRGDCAMLKLFLQHNADVNQVDMFGRTCLFAAINFGQASAVSCLLNFNAKVNLADNTGHSPLMMAAAGGQLRIVRMLLEASANVQHCANNGQTALHDASANGSDELVSALLQANADPHPACALGVTALSSATRNKSPSNVMRVLLNANADINAVDHKGYTPLIHATIHDNALAAKFLLDNGADLLKKGHQSARQLARKTYNVHTLFDCSLCCWDGMCCPKCRKKYCRFECDKFSGKFLRCMSDLFQSVFSLRSLQCCDRQSGL